MVPKRRPLVALVGALGFVLSAVVVWLAAEGVFRLARIGPPPPPGAPGAGPAWRAYLWLLGGIFLALLGVAACLRVVRHLRGDDRTG